MAVIQMRFPGGYAKTLTLSYDDGVDQDIRLIDIMHRHGLKGTFNINSGLYAPEGHVWPEGEIHRRMTVADSQKLYLNSGMEVAVHSLTHPFLEKLSQSDCAYEILEDRKNLERDYGCVVRGMAYPFGTFSDEVVEVLRRCGISYARTVISTEQFLIPTDWLRLPATCKHTNPRLMKLAREFVHASQNGEPMMFYLWGHSYEFERDDNWHVIEEFAEYIGNRDDIWYATNIEICDYVHSYEKLVVLEDEVFNPTEETLWFRIPEKGVFSLKPNQRMKI